LTDGGKEKEGYERCLDFCIGIYIKSSNKQGKKKKEGGREKKSLPVLVYFSYRGRGRTDISQGDNGKRKREGKSLPLFQLYIVSDRREVRATKKGGKVGGEGVVAAISRQLKQKRKRREAGSRYFLIARQIRISKRCKTQKGGRRGSKRKTVAGLY